MIDLATLTAATMLRSSRSVFFAGFVTLSDDSKLQVYGRRAVLNVVARSSGALRLYLGVALVAML